MKWMIIQFFIILNIYVAVINGAKLLIFSISNSKSHMMSNGRIADALALAGHNATLFNVEHSISFNDFPTTKHANVITIGRIPEERRILMKKGKTEALKGIFDPPGFFDSYTFFTPFIDITEEVIELALAENMKTINKLKAENFDAIFVEHHCPYGNAFGHLLGIKVHFLINTSPMIETVARLFGIPNPSGWVPALGHLPTSDKMTFLERGINLLQHLIMDSSRTRLITSATRLFRKHFGDDFPDVGEIIQARTPLIFVNVNEFLEFPRPILHNVVYVGGMGMKSAASNTSLSEEFQIEMSKGKQGVIFFSLGSNVDTTHLPNRVKKNLIDAFAAFPDYHFIIKLEHGDDYGIEYAKTKPNIFVTHWAPQSLLLKHPRLKLFFTHAGYNSLLEAAEAGVPLLLMPMMYDQTRNAQVIQRNGWGRVIDKQHLVKGNDKLVAMLKEMLNNNKYQEAAHRIKHLLATKPFKPDDVFIKHVNFVLANNGELPELKPASIDMNFVTQNNIDVYGLFGAAILGLLILIYYAFKAILSLIFSKRVSKMDSKKVN